MSEGMQKGLSASGANSLEQSRIVGFPITVSQMKKSISGDDRVRITSLPPDRWEDFRELRLESLRKEPKAFLSSYEDEAGLGKGVWQERIKNAVFAVVNDKPVGMMTYLRRGRRKNDHIADIFAVYVDKKHRGKGIADRLLKHVISRVKKNDSVSKIALSVVADQTPAVSLYMKHNFKVVGVLEKELKLNGSFYDELVMELVLK
jgi:ribosomal protein S18 acetylase RimI-like enzyme